jgi:RNA polymerase sigma-70 factor (ECF subfamily)
MDTEAGLLARAKKGDAPAFERLITPYLPMLFAYGRAICGDYHAAQDVVQETAIIAFRNLGHLFPEADFPTWLRAVARRQALEARRKLHRQARFAEEAIERTYQEPSPPSVTIQRTLLVDCIRALGDRGQTVVQEHYFQGSKLTEVAARLKMSLAAVKQLLYRARKLLEECVRKRQGAELHP